MSTAVVAAGQVMVEGAIKEATVVFQVLQSVLLSLHTTIFLIESWLTDDSNRIQQVLPARKIWQGSLEGTVGWESTHSIYWV